MKKLSTLGEFIINNQKDFKGSTGELSRLINAIRLAAKVVNHEVNKAGLVDILGAAGETNIQGEEQQKLDVYANDIFMQTLTNREIVCGIASEEEDEFVIIKGNGNHETKYVVLMDPLDGSSNVDVNVSVGTIFSIYERVTPKGKPVTQDDFLQKGNKQVAAGYVVYGTSTMLVYTTGKGVNGFTLNPAIGTFYLSHPNMKYPEKGDIYSINEAGYVHFPQGVKDYLKFIQEQVEKGRKYTSRYIGSLVSDFHRNMIKGGIYIYPTSTKNPKGKLRLLYECNPMAFLAEQANGKASDGYKRILDIKPTELHQRVPFFCGSKSMLAKVEGFMAVYPEDAKY